MKNNQYTTVLAAILFSIGLTTVSTVAMADTTDEPVVQRRLPDEYYSDRPLSNDAIKEEVMFQLSQEPGLDISQINVEVTGNANVSITGTVANEEQAKRVLQIAASAGAAKWVESSLSVASN